TLNLLSSGEGARGSARVGRLFLTLSVLPFAVWGLESKSDIRKASCRWLSRPFLPPHHVVPGSTPRKRHRSAPSIRQPPPPPHPSRQRGHRAQQQHPHQGPVPILRENRRLQRLVRRPLDRPDHALRHHRVD